MNGQIYSVRLFDKNTKIAASLIPPNFQIKQMHVWSQSWIKMKLQTTITTRTGAHFSSLVSSNMNQRLAILIRVHFCAGMPRPAPLLSRTPAIPADTSMSLDWGQHTREILAEEGYTTNQIDTFLKDNIAQQAELSSKL